MPASHGIHPVLNIAHLEKYQTSPPEFSERPQKSLNQEDFDDLPEYEVERIVAECQKKGRNGKHILQYLTRFKGYSEEFNEWLSENQLKNAPEPLELWKKEKERLLTKWKESSGNFTAFLATTVPRVIKRSHVPFEPPSFQSSLKNSIKVVEFAYDSFRVTAIFQSSPSKKNAYSISSSSRRRLLWP